MIEKKKNPYFSLTLCSSKIHVWACVWKHAADKKNFILNEYLEFIGFSGLWEKNVLRVRFCLHKNSPGNQV